MQLLQSTIQFDSDFYNISCEYVTIAFDSSCFVEYDFNHILPNWKLGETCCKDEILDLMESIFSWRFYFTVMDFFLFGRLSSYESRNCCVGSFHWLTNQEVYAWNFKRNRSTCSYLSAAKLCRKLESFVVKNSNTIILNDILKRNLYTIDVT